LLVQFIKGFNPFTTDMYHTHLIWTLPRTPIF